MDSTEGPNYFVPMSNVTGVVRSPFQFPQFYLADRQTFHLLAVYLLFLIAVGLPSNAMMFHVIFHNNKLRTPITYILLNLAVADLFMVVGGFPLALLVALQGYFVLGFPGCNIQGFFVRLGASASLWAMVVLVFERWVKLCRPFKKFRFGRYPSVLGVCFLWLLAFTCAVPPLLGFSRYIPEGLQCSCGIDYYTVKPGIANEPVVLYMFVVHFAIPSTFICLCFVRLLCSMNPTVEGQSEAARRAEWETTRTVMVMILAFFICWGPYTWVSWNIFMRHGAVFRPVFITKVSFFAMSSAIHFPFVYLILNAQFRDCVIRTLCQGNNPFQVKGSVASATESLDSNPEANDCDPESE